jgi:hypothetical protein
MMTTLYRSRHGLSIGFFKFLLRGRRFLWETDGGDEVGISGGFMFCRWGGTRASSTKKCDSTATPKFEELVEWIEKKPKPID